MFPAVMQSCHLVISSVKDVHFACDLFARKCRMMLMLKRCFIFVCISCAKFTFFSCCHANLQFAHFICKNYAFCTCFCLLEMSSHVVAQMFHFSHTICQFNVYHVVTQICNLQISLVKHVHVACDLLSEMSSDVVAQILFHFCF